MRSFKHTLLFLAAASLSFAGCIKDGGHVLETGATVSVEGARAGQDAYLFMWDAAGRKVASGYYQDARAMEVPGLERGAQYSVGVLTGPSELANVRAENISTLNEVAFMVNAATVASWRQDGVWPAVSVPSESGSRSYTLPDCGKTDEGLISVSLHKCGTPVGLRIDASSLSGWSIEVKDVWMTAKEGEYHPFSGEFLAGVVSADQRPTSAEQAALQSQLIQTRSSSACTFHVLDNIRRTQSALHVTARFHREADGVTLAGGYIYPVASSFPEGYDPVKHLLSCVLYLVEDSSTILGTWSVTINDQQ